MFVKSQTYTKNPGHFQSLADDYYLFQLSSQIFKTMEWLVLLAVVIVI